MTEQLIGGPIGNWLAIIGVISLLYWAWRIAMALQNRGPHPQPEAVVPAPAAAATEYDDDLVVVAAAVYAMTAGRRVVEIAPAAANQSWASEGRWAQQNSHSPR